MRRRSKREQFRQPTLVPLADMLCNTLGIVIFILVFTVLTTGNAVTHTRFPKEQSDSTLHPIMVICSGDRICPVRTKEMMEDLKRFLNSSKFEDIGKWKYEDSYCKSSYTRFPQRKIEAKPNSGDTPSDVGYPGSALDSFLRSESSKAKFVFFIVYPDGLAAFKAARDVARNAGFQIGWTPFEAGGALYLGSNSSGGITPTPD